MHSGTWRDPSVAETEADADALWSTHRTLKRRLLNEVEARTGVHLPEDGLLVGFARRVAGYKRSDLILRHSERIHDELASGRWIQLLHCKIPLRLPAFVPPALLCVFHEGKMDSVLAMSGK